MDEENERRETKTKDSLAPALKAGITGLRQKNRYLFQIRTGTSKGEGPVGGAKETKTEDKGNDCDCSDI